MTSSRVIFFAALFLALGPLSGCRVTNDLGKECRMVRRDPSDDAGIRSVPITEGEIPEDSNAKKDFISFGSTECEDYVCVRDADAPRNPDPSAPAYGYCSRPCTPNGAVGCVATAGNNVDGRPLSCRSLFLESETLARICKDDPVTCQQVFGSSNSPYYCAKGSGVADGGSL